MRREQQIPLFLWVATALVAHALGGGGATEVAQRLEETLDIKSFASEVRRQARYAGPLEVSLEVDPAEPVPKPAPPKEADPRDDLPESEAPKDEELPEEKEEVTPPQVKPEPPPVEKEKEKEKPLEEKKETPPEEKKPELSLADKPKPKIVPNRRVAVEQHVKDKAQEDNPDAEFAGEYANRVKEQTQARITASDQNDPEPTPGGNHTGPDPNPGNADESRVAQSDENDAPDDARPGGARPSQAGSPPSTAQASQTPGQQKTAENEVSPKAQQAQDAQKALNTSEGRDGMAHTHSHAHGGWSIAEAEEARKAQKKQEAREALARVTAKVNRRKDPLLGYGSVSTTEQGVNLNLNPKLASQVIGQDQLDNLKAEVGKRRLSKHRGSFQNLGLKKWKGALENYVASVKPGNQTALNTAAVPFAGYLNQIHQRLHEVFAYDFLGHLEQLPAKHPLNNPDMSTHIEIALSREDGRIVKMGITKSSGVTAFDVGALESVSKAAPYGTPPGSIVSSDGNVYLHWEFHRRREYACSTYFAHPYIINTGPESAPPRVDPPRQPQPDEDAKPDERSGALEQDRKSQGPESG